MRTEQACPPTFRADARAGIEALHPMRCDFDVSFDVVGGVGFDDVVALPQAPMTWSSYLPQISWNGSLRNQGIAAPRLGIKIGDVMRHGRIRTAEEVREHMGIPEATEIVLLLFDRDDVLEQFADGADSFLRQAAEGRYVTVAAPSYSLWTPQRRPDNLLSLRRSMLFFREFQALGAQVLPRVGWVERIDMERFAEWINTNPGVSHVAIDLMTYRGEDFSRHIGLMVEFDALTHERLHYLVNGVGATNHIAALYFASSTTRVTVTDATMRKAPRIGPNGRRQNGYRARVGWAEARCGEASRHVEELNETAALDTVLRLLEPIPARAA